MGAQPPVGALSALCRVGSLAGGLPAASSLCFRTLCVTGAVELLRKSGAQRSFAQGRAIQSGQSKAQSGRLHGQSVSIESGRGWPRASALRRQAIKHNPIVQRSQPAKTATDKERKIVSPLFRSKASWRMLPPASRRSACRRWPSMPSFASIHGVATRDKTQVSYLGSVAAQAPGLFCLPAPGDPVPMDGGTRVEVLLKNNPLEK